MFLDMSTEHQTERVFVRCAHRRLCHSFFFRFVCCFVIELVTYGKQQYFTVFIVKMYGNCWAQILLHATELCKCVPFCHHRCCRKPFKWMLSHEMHFGILQSRARFWLVWLQLILQTLHSAHTERNCLLFILRDAFRCNLLWNSQVHRSNKILCISYDFKILEIYCECK